MGFGEEYQGMSDREIIIEMATEQRSLRQAVERIRCPSPRCNEHEAALAYQDNRIQVLEDEKKNKSDSKQNTYLFWGLLISAIAGWGGLIIALADIITRGG